MYFFTLLTVTERESQLDDIDPMAVVVILWADLGVAGKSRLGVLL